MAESFDPYHVWLGIPSKDQPPSHYRLLALEPFESDPQVIVAAAEQRMMHLRTYQLGKHVAWSQRLLNEVAGAKVCLLDPEEKAAYDERLRHEMQPPGPPPALIVAAPAVALERIPTQADVPASRHISMIGGLIFAALVVTGLGLWIAGPAKPDLRAGPAAEPTPRTEFTVKPHMAAPKVEAAAEPAVSSEPQANSRPKTDRSGADGVPNDWVTIVNRDTGKEIGKSQAMRIEPAGRFYRIRRRDGRFLALADGGKQKGTGRHQIGFFQFASDSKDPGLLWHIKRLGNGFWLIANSTTGKCLESHTKRNVVPDGEFRPGDPSQEWRFEPVKGP